MKNIRFEKAKLDDYELFLPVWLEFSKLHSEKAPYYFVETDKNLFSKKLFEDLILDCDNTLFLLAKDGEDCIGYVLAEKRKSSCIPIFKKRKFLFIEDIVVIDKYKGKGIGTLLMLESEKWAEENNIFEIELKVRNFNENAINFYLNKGYKSFSQQMRKELK